MGRAFAADPANKQQWTTFAEDVAVFPVAARAARACGITH